ncbi:uncharacterized protein BDR25DRAFT_347581 [Lindgomyces ingoldianus]|uniref:Uncharacterized protein n=1 Tax=Lindgomyces ingoldianus TaxID=673940 RepID=A0ACB6Q762_9PLEO|nr:uncharacterized protein BDR25DRAFT_347581 [Lindgomyces ingoldianus]KAF2462794.1 hypothetical protein BDR25DRAFT_347581 [Lindgomyces ingoldianus]
MFKSGLVLAMAVNAIFAHPQNTLLERDSTATSIVTPTSIKATEMATTSMASFDYHLYSSQISCLFATPYMNCLSSGLEKVTYNAIPNPSELWKLACSTKSVQYACDPICSVTLNSDSSDFLFHTCTSYFEIKTGFISPTAVASTTIGPNTSTSAIPSAGRGTSSLTMVSSSPKTSASTATANAISRAGVAPFVMQTAVAAVAAVAVTEFSKLESPTLLPPAA